MFLRKSSGALDLLTEAKLERRFRPPGRDLSCLYAGYYVAELLSELTDDYDPHPALFDLAERNVCWVLSRGESVSKLGVALRIGGIGRARAFAVVGNLCGMWQECTRDGPIGIRNVGRRRAVLGLPGRQAASGVGARRNDSSHGMPGRFADRFVETIRTRWADPRRAAWPHEQLPGSLVGPSTADAGIPDGVKSVMTRMSLLIPAKFFFLLAMLCAAVGMIGCKGTPIDVAKGRPSDNDIPDDVKSDFDAKEPTGWERFSPENLGKTMKKAVGMGPNQKIGEGLFDEAEKLFADKKYDKAASKFAAAADRWPNSTLEEDSMFLRAESYFFADKYSMPTINTGSC